ncbi:hypothetical protein C4B24_02395 [Mycoplasma marinum]|uniref:AAA+ ATPase domain-containing protein n=2 Tax=Mycoplasma marinum TaxID=1937190 RepID=A0A4R0XP37_9MOLU|nr:hypothetical protein C4B24_02395 [Mycoplasma marinum]
MMTKIVNDFFWHKLNNTLISSGLKANIYTTEEEPEWNTTYGIKIGLKRLVLVIKIKGKFLHLKGNLNFNERINGVEFWVANFSLHGKDISRNGITVMLEDAFTDINEFQELIEELAQKPGFILKAGDTTNILSAIQLYKEMDDYKQENQSYYWPINSFKQKSIFFVDNKNISTEKIEKIKGMNNTFVDSSQLNKLAEDSYGKEVILFESKPLKDMKNASKTLRTILRDGGKLIYSSTKDKEAHNATLKLIDFNIKKINKNESIVSLMVDAKDLILDEEQMFCIYDRLSYIKSNTMLSVVRDIKARRLNNNNLFEYLFNNGEFNEVGKIDDWIIDQRQANKHLQILNKEQKRAFNLAIDNHPIAFIQGPPGTGKTFTITEMCKYYASIGKRVLVSSQTNVAVENIMENLMNDLEYRDLCVKADSGKSDYSHEKIDRLYSNKIKEMLDLEELDLSYVNFKDLIAKSMVIGSTTTSSSLRNRIWDGFMSKIDVLIIDEISKSSVPELIRYVVNSKKVIFVGDQRQLAPLDDFVDSDIQKRYSDLDLKIIKEYISVSIFDKLFNDANKNRRAIMLKENRRSVRGILDAYSTFYGDELIATREDNDSKIKWKGKPYYPFTFLAMNGSREENVGTSRKNILEAQYIDTLLNELGDEIENSQELSVAIIATYGAQVKTIKDNVTTIKHERQNFKSIKINTVDAFQGDQADIVIVSTVVSDISNRSIGFISDYRRLNVAISRSKDLTFVLGNDSILRSVVMKYDSQQRMFFGEIFKKMKNVDLAGYKNNIILKKVV